MFGFVAPAVFLTLVCMNGFIAGYKSQDIEPITTVQACVGSNVTLSCPRTGPFDMKFKWTYDGMPTSPDEHLLTQGKNNSILLIKSYAPKSAGLYFCKELKQNGDKLFEKKFRVVTASSNISTRIVHHQYYEDHLLFIHFKNVSTENASYVLEYKCLYGYEIFPLCVRSWQGISQCGSNKTGSDTYFNCMILHTRVLLNFQYNVRAAVKTKCGWKNQTAQFQVKIPNFTEPLQDLKAIAVDHNTVRLSWKKVYLLRDVQNFETENLKMVMKIVISSGNSSSTKNIYLKPFTTSTMLYGFTALQNYSFAVSYHLIVSGLDLESSKVAGPVMVQIPEKVTRSDPAVNGSCFESTNSTKPYFTISWMIPRNSRNIGQSVEARLKVTYSGTEMFYNLLQTPGTRESIVIEATENLDVEVSLCNEAGCSESSNIACIIPGKRYIDTSTGTINLKYIITCTVASVGLITIFLLVLYYFKKRKNFKKENKQEAHLPTYGPRHFYDDASVTIQNYLQLPDDSRSSSQVMPDCTTADFETVP